MTDPVLLTGASGFVGRAVLAELIARGILVHAVSRRPGKEQTGVVWHKADLLTEGGRKTAAGLAPRLIHCAWDVEFGTFWTSPANAVWCTASVDLIKQFRAAGGGQVLAIGTCAEYDAQHSGPWNEARPIVPATVYGQAKATLYDALTALCGEDLIWARLFHLYGPGEDRRRFIPSLIDALKEGRSATVRAAELLRDFASTGHVARCLVRLLEAQSQGAYDIGTGQPRKLGDLARITANAARTSALLDLSHNPNPADPASMAPELHRLFQATEFLPEMPEDSLLSHVARELITGRYIEDL
jgi:nucleoside-diphosphate-sugar epimerase